MPGSLNYSPSGSEGGKSLGGGGADLIGVDLVATPGEAVCFETFRVRSIAALATWVDPCGENKTVASTNALITWTIKEGRT